MKYRKLICLLICIFQTDSKANNNGVYGSFVADPYATVPGRAKANIYTEEPSFGGDDSRSINR